MTRFRLWAPQAHLESWYAQSHPDEDFAAYDKRLCASLDGFTLHAATCAGAWDTAGREALLRYVLRPPIAQERLLQRPDGLVRIGTTEGFGNLILVS